MTDLVPKGTGNSRLLRSSIPADITHEELVALLRAGTFPVDFAGLNADGVAVVGSAYNKANVLPDDVCTDLGIDTSAEPKDAFSALKELSNKNKDDLFNRFVLGTYTGNGNNGRQINLGFTPIAVFIRSTGFLSNAIYHEYTFYGVESETGPSSVEITDVGFTLSEGTSSPRIA